MTGPLRWYAEPRFLFGFEAVDAALLERTVRTGVGEKRIRRWRGAMSENAAEVERLGLENEALRRRVAVLEAEERFRTTLYCIGDAVIATDAAGLIAQMNPVAESLTGWSEADAGGRAADEVFQIVDEDTGARFENPVARVLRDGLVLGLADHTALVARDGTRRPIAGSGGAPIRDGAGTVVGVVLVFRDQSLARRAEKEVGAAEERFRTFFDNAPIGKCMTAPDGRLLRVNPAFGAMLGYSVEEMQTLSFASITHPDDLAESRECVRALLAGEQDTWVMDKRYLAKGGRYVWTRVTTRLQRDDERGPLHFLTHIQDITEQKNATEALRESEEKYRGLFDNAQVGMYRSRLDGSGIIALNQRLADLFGFTKEEMINSPATLRWADPRAREEMVRVLREGGELREHELDIVTSGGTIRTVLASMKLYPREGYLEGTAIDITARKAAEQALLEARESLERRVAERTAELEKSKGLLDEAGRLARVGGWELDLRGNVLTWTEVTRQIHEVAPDYEPTVETAINFFAPEAVPVISQAVRMAIEAGSPYDVELPFITATGRRIWVRAIGKAYFADGAVARIGGVIQDITDRMLEEEAARLSRQRLDLHVTHTPLAVIEFTIDGRIARWNPAAAEIFGFTEEEAVGQYWTFVVPEEVWGQLDGVWEQLVSQRGGSRSTNPNRHKSGRTLHCEWFNTPLITADGTTMGVASLVMDVTERKLAQEELAKHRDHLQELVDVQTAKLKLSEARLVEAQRVARVGSWKWDTAKDEITGSEEFYRLFDVAPEELARFEQFVERLHPDDREHVQRDVTESLQQDRPYDTDYRAKLSDGSWRDLNARGRAVADAEGKPVHLVGTCQDISERKQAERALARSNRELEQFAYVASHDLQEPLRMVSSYTQLLARRYQNQLDQDAMDFIGYAVDGANRMQRLIQDLLEYSRVTTRGQTPAPVDAHDALGEAVRNLQAAIQEASALVTNDELPQVTGDRTQIAQVFQNLVGNGIKFRKLGEPPRVHLSAEPNQEQPGFWTFKVSDNGIGIEARHFERLFVIFQRLHGKQEYPGTGIGLALCKRIVERHGGTIWLESEAGQGTTFYFTLPSAERGGGERQ